MYALHDEIFFCYTCYDIDFAIPKYFLLEESSRIFIKNRYKVYQTNNKKDLS